MNKKHDKFFSKIGTFENYVNNLITKNSGKVFEKIKKMGNFFLMDMVRDLIFKKEEKKEGRAKAKTSYHRNDKLDFMNVDQFVNITSNDEGDKK